MLSLPLRGARTPVLGRQLPQAVIEAPQRLHRLAIVQLSLCKGARRFSGWLCMS